MKFVKTRGYKKQTMLCAKYDYKMDIAVKQEEAKEEKAIETAVLIVKKYKATPESAASDVGAPLDKVLEALEKTK